MARRASECRAVLRPIPRRTLLPQSRSKPELHGPDAEKPAGLPAGSQEFGSLPPPVRQGWLDYLSDPRFGPERVFALVIGFMILLVLPLALAVLFIDDIEEALKDPTQPARESPRRAAELAPSTPLYSNRHYLFLIAAGDLEPVRDRMKLGARRGLQNATDGWIVAAAALHLLDGQPTQAAEMLARASASLTKTNLACLLEDPVFDPYRQSPTFAKYLAKPAPPQ